MFLLQIGQVLGRGFYLLFSLWYLNRYLGLEAKGLWAAMFSLLTILSVLSNMGFELWMSRAAAADTVSGRQAIAFMFRVKSLLWLVCLGFGAWLVADEPGSWPLATAFAVALVLDGIGVAQQAVFEGKRAIAAMILMSFLKSGGFSILALAVGLWWPQVALAVFGWLFAAVLLVRILYGWRAWQLLPTREQAFPKQAYSAFVTMGAFTLVTVLYFKIDMIMLSEMAGDVVTGHYANAYDLVEGALFFSAAVNSVLYPRLVIAGGEARAQLFDRLFRFVLAVAALGIAATWLLGGWFGQLIAGEAFIGSMRPLAILAVGLPFMFGNGLLSRWLFSEQRERFALVTAAAMALFNIAGNWILIPRYGAEGAAVMTLATEGILFLIWLFWGRVAPSQLWVWFLLMVPVAATGILMFYLERPLLAGGVATVTLLPVLLVYIYRVRELSEPTGKTYRVHKFAKRKRNSSENAS